MFLLEVCSCEIDGRTSAVRWLDASLEHLPGMDDVVD